MARRQFLILKIEVRILLSQFIYLEVYSSMAEYSLDKRDVVGSTPSTLSFLLCHFILTNYKYL